MALTKTQVDEIIAKQKYAKEQFLSAWKDGVSLHPELFDITTSSGDIDTANDKWQLCPASEDEWKNIICKLSRGERTFLASMVSFYNSSRGQDLLTEIGSDNICDIASRLDETRSRIITTLFMNYGGW